MPQYQKTIEHAFFLGLGVALLGTLSYEAGYPIMASLLSIVAGIIVLIGLVDAYGQWAGDETEEQRDKFEINNEV